MLFCHAKNQSRRAIASFVAFDLLHIDGEDQRKMAWKSVGRSWTQSSPGVDGILFSEHIEAVGAVVFEKACEMGLEGIVSKRLGGAYWSGRCRNLGEDQEPGVPEKMIRPLSGPARLSR